MVLDDKQRSLAKDYRNFSHENLVMASRRVAELSDEFTRLEVQIATILFAFAGLFLGFFGKADAISSPDLVAASLALKIIYSTALFFLLASLVAGLLHLKRKEKFWESNFVSRGVRFRHWSDCLHHDGNFEEAHEFHMGVSMGVNDYTSSPVWTWILQTIFLCVAVAILFVLAMIILFAR